MPVPRGKTSLPTRLSKTELFPLLCKQTKQKTWTLKSLTSHFKEWNSGKFNWDKTTHSTLFNHNFKSMGKQEQQIRRLTIFVTTWCFHFGAKGPDRYILLAVQWRCKNKPPFNLIMTRIYQDRQILSPLNACHGTPLWHLSMQGAHTSFTISQ